MGFFSSLIKTVVGIGRAVIGLPPAAVAPAARVTLPVIASQAAGAIRATGGIPTTIATGAVRIGAAIGAAGRAAVTSPVGRIAVPAAVGAGVGLAAGAALGGGGGGGGALVMGGGLGGGNGQFAKQTIVQTVLLATGEVVRQEVFAGAPFAMQKDINRIRTLDRKLTKAANRIRSKSRGPSKQKMLTDAVVDSAMRQVIAPCPPKC